LLFGTTSVKQFEFKCEIYGMYVRKRIQ